MEKLRKKRLAAAKQGDKQAKRMLKVVKKYQKDKAAKYRKTKSKVSVKM